MRKNNILFALTIIIFAVFSRLIPHAYNFSPFGAIALFGAAYFTNKWFAYLIPVIAAWISGVMLNNTIYSSLHPEFTWLDYNFFWQSLSYVAIVGFGHMIFNQGVSKFNVIGGALASSIIFFLVSNFGVWISDIFYPHNFSGLLACYIAAVPFYAASLFGDLIYCTILFGVYHLISKRIFLADFVK